MKDFNKTDIQKIAKYTNWNSKGIAEVLEDFIYPNRKNWVDFSKILTLVLGAGLFGIGVIFFFAYNWDAIPKFTKLSIIFGLILVFTILSILPKLSRLSKQICLTLAATMVGVLFAVFGQIYQTGANAYDFFLAWAIFSFIWVLVARFIPLWILYIALLNTTLFFYFDQIKPNVETSLILNCFYILNLVALVINCAIWYYKKLKPNKIITYLLVITCVGLSTVYAGFFILSDDEITVFDIFLILHLASFAFIVWLGLTYKQAFYIAIIGLALLFIVCFITIRLFPNEFIYFPMMLIITLGTTGIILAVSKLIKKWKNE